ncbi:ABC transporter ATP-binding protein [Marinimicrobium sp. ABcell2]|uniref:ABC transporter ATP-binding protein n=1 Tax=Marinimicrobium sp. ABcell2 TaxID=3069751 RepID=UPI0027B14BA6|nr:ABC transporter ATP-binding protein [Marinimicrobium sp. ABcell2]MDQ2076026.1 ABC transporter ATP-binding protein [Marinimicrobium sp. ABcell2]
METQVLDTVNINALRRQVDGQDLLSNISASIGPGEVVGLLGKNGAGKTTLLETILGFALPTSGQSSLWGEPADRLAADTKQRIGYVPQQDELITSMRGAQHLDLYRALRPHWNHDLVERLCREWNVPLNRTVARLSVGERQKLSIVLALAHEPELLVLDEPVASLDPLARRQFIRQLIDVAADGERSIIFSSHIVSDIERLATNIWLLDSGTLLWQGAQDALKESVVALSWPDQGRQPTLNGVLHQSLVGRQVRCICRDWSEHNRPSLEQELGVPIEVEYLNLEEIFLAMTGGAS